MMPDKNKKNTELISLLIPIKFSMVIENIEIENLRSIKKKRFFFRKN